VREEVQSKLSRAEAAELENRIWAYVNVVTEWTSHAGREMANEEYKWDPGELSRRRTDTYNRLFGYLDAHTDFVLKVEEDY
jgi:hypothetical protein